MPIEWEEAARRSVEASSPPSPEATRVLLSRLRQLRAARESSERLAQEREQHRAEIFGVCESYLSSEITMATLLRRIRDLEQRDN